MGEYRQPSSAQYQPKSESFRHGLFECCESCEDCLLAHFCPSCYAYCASKEAGEGFLYAFLQCFFYPLGVCCLRANVREKRAIKGNLLADCLVGNLLPCCASIQIKREFS